MVRLRFRSMSLAAIVAIALLTLGAPSQAERLENPVLGPKQLCFKYSAFALNAGERVNDFSGSMEGMSITVKSPAGRYEIAESEIFSPPAGEEASRLCNGKNESLPHCWAGTEICDLWTGELLSRAIRSPNLVVG